MAAKPSFNAFSAARVLTPASISVTGSTAMMKALTRPTPKGVGNGRVSTGSDSCNRIGLQDSRWAGATSRRPSGCIWNRLLSYAPPMTPAALRWLGIATLTLSLFISIPAAAVSDTNPSPTASPSAGTRPSQSLIPPYAGDDAPMPVRTRQDRIVSTIAPIGMVVVLIAGLYVYWLIRKGL